MSEVQGVLSTVGLVVLSAFFSGSETALLSSRRVTLTALANDGDRFAKLALKLVDDPGDLLGTILVGNNLVNVAAAAIAAAAWGSGATAAPGARRAASG